MTQTQLCVFIESLSSDRASPSRAVISALHLNTPST